MKMKVSCSWKWNGKPIEGVGEGGILEYDVGQVDATTTGQSIREAIMECQAHSAEVRTDELSLVVTFEH